MKRTILLEFDKDSIYHNSHYYSQWNSSEEEERSSGVMPVLSLMVASAEATDRPRQGFLVFHFSSFSVLFFVSLWKTMRLCACICIYMRTFSRDASKSPQVMASERRTSLEDLRSMKL